MNWHVDGALMGAYLEDRIDPIVAASVEQHLLSCGPCRAALAGASPMPRTDLDDIWLGVRDAVEVPDATFVERWATRLGLRDSEARLLAAVPSLRVSWLAGLALASAMALLAARVGGDRSIALFLYVAPLAPMAGVALAFGPHADPAHEVVAAAPYPALRLLLLRSAAVLITSIPVVALTAALLPVPSWVAVGWLLPALAFAFVALALSAWMPLEHAAAGIGLAWAAAIVLAAAGGRITVLLAPELQPLYLSLLLIALGVVVVRGRSAARLTWRNP